MLAQIQIGMDDYACLLSVKSNLPKSKQIYQIDLLRLQKRKNS